MRLKILKILTLGLILPWVCFNVQPGQGAQFEKAIFAGGCFWCMEASFERLRGVKSVVSGYSGGSKENPTYQEVSSGTSGHAEAIEVTYDPQEILYGKLLNIYWENVDPTVLNRQFVDEGTQYRTAIFYHNDEQKRLAEESKEKLEKSGKFNQPIVTEILPAKVFYEAEAHHQDYYKTHPVQYELYRSHSGRPSSAK